MVHKSDPAAEKLKARKERNKTRKNNRLAAARARNQSHIGRHLAAVAALRNQDSQAAERIVLEIRGEQLQRAIAIDEECGECQSIQRKATA